MNRTIQTIAIFVFITSGLFAQDSQITNVFARNTTILNGVWKYIVDP